MNTEPWVDRNLDAALIAVSAALMAVVGWMGHTLATASPLPNATRLLGGAILAGFVGWVSVIMLQQTGMDPKVCAALAAMIGAMGERGLYFLWETYIHNRHSSP